MVSRIAAIDDVMDRLGDLVHRSVGRQDAGFAAHRWFIATRLAIGIAGLVLMAVCFGISGGLPRSALLVSTVLSFQAVIALIVSRFGGLMIGSLISTASLCGLPLVGAGFVGVGAMVPFIRRRDFNRCCWCSDDSLCRSGGIVCDLCGWWC